MNRRAHALRMPGVSILERTIRRHRRTGQPSNDAPHTTGGDTAPAEESPSFVLWIPALEPRRMEHCVTFTDAANTAKARNGIYTSICGIRFALPHP
jgi:hypothetical protein